MGGNETRIQTGQEKENTSVCVDVVNFREGFYHKSVALPQHVTNSVHI